MNDVARCSSLYAGVGELVAETRIVNIEEPEDFLRYPEVVVSCNKARSNQRELFFRTSTSKRESSMWMLRGRNIVLRTCF